MNHKGSSQGTFAVRTHVSWRETRLMPAGWVVLLAGRIFVKLGNWGDRTHLEGLGYLTVSFDYHVVIQQTISMIVQSKDTYSVYNIR